MPSVSARVKEGMGDGRGIMTNLILIYQASRIINENPVIRSNQVPRKRETPGLFTLALESLERELLFGYNAWREELEQRVRGNVEMRESL